MLCLRKQKVMSDGEKLRELVRQLNDARKNYNESMTFEEQEVFFYQMKSLEAKIRNVLK